jgi:hypothetical protein
MTKRIFSLAIVFMMFVPVTGLLSQVTLTVPDTTCMRGDTLKIPVYCSNLSGLNVISLQFQMEYNPLAIEWLGFRQSGTVSAAWNAPVVYPAPGRISLSMASATPLSGSGVLLFALFRFVSNPTSDRSPLALSNVMLNEGTPSVDVVNGAIRYLSIRIVPHDATILENESLDFELQGDVHTPAYWSVTDTSVASISSTGVFIPKKTGFCRVVVRDSRNLTDTSNNILINPLQLSQFTLSIGDTSAMQGGSFLYPVRVSDMTGLGILSGQFGISFTAGILSIDSVLTSGTLLHHYGPPVIKKDAGNITLSFAGTIPLSGSGVLVYLKINAKKSMYGFVSLHLHDVLFNESIHAATRDGSINVQGIGYLTVSVSATTIFTGDTVRCTVTGYPSSPSSPVLWSVSDPSMATISSSGVLVATRHGSIQVQAMDALGRTGSSQTILIYDITLTVGNTSAATSGFVDVPLVISAWPNGILSAQMNVDFDTTYLSSPTVYSVGTLLAGSQISTVVHGNRLTFAVASTNSVRTSGTLLKIRFSVLESAPKLTSTQVTLSNVLLNEGTPLPLITNGQVFIISDKSYNLDIKRGWNMVSIPLIVTDFRKDSLFRTATSKAFTYHSGYVMKDTLANGVGFWVKFGGAQSVYMTGILCKEDTIDVVHGWNMIGSIFSPVPVDSIVQIPNPIVTSVYWGYDGTYQASDTVEPGKAYWVKTNGGGQLVLKKSRSNAQPKYQRKEEQILEHVNTLKIVDANGRSQNLYLGEISLVGSLLDRFELPPPSPSGTFDARFRSQGCMEGYTLDSKGNTFIIDVKADAYPLALGCNIIDDNVKFSLSKGENLSRFALEKGNTITISSPVEQLIIEVYPITKPAIPKEYALEQNYPNPFNPSTIIRYDLPIDAKVTLKMYNVLGQEVRTVVDEIQEAGYKSVTFNASDMASGVYFYRLEVTSTSDPSKSFVQVKKSLLLK